MGDRVRGVSHDGGGGELHPDRGHRGRGREQCSAHQQSRLPHSSQGGTLPSFAQQSNCIFVFSASQENVFLNKNRDVDVFCHLSSRRPRHEGGNINQHLYYFLYLFFVSRKHQHHFTVTTHTK